MTFYWMGSAQIRVDYTVYAKDLTNDPPNGPGIPSGSTSFLINEEQVFSTSSEDPDGDDVYYRWAFGDGDTSDWMGPYDSEEACDVTHTWTEVGDFDITVLAKDKFGAESGWSDILQVSTYNYTCGDADGNSIINIADAVALIGFIFGGGTPPDPLLSGDADCNEIINIADAVFLIGYIFGGGAAPCSTCP